MYIVRAKSGSYDKQKRKDKDNDRTRISNKNKPNSGKNASGGIDL